MVFKIQNCDFGIKINGTSYDFDHVVELQVEDNERKRLTRGANAKNTVGIVFTEGLRDAKKWTIPILNMSAALKEVLDNAFVAETRMDVYCIDRASGSSKMAKTAILSNRPQQLSISEGQESMNVALEFETFDSSEVHKS